MMADKQQHKSNEFQTVVESLMKGMDTVLSTKTVVGEAIKVDNTIIMPLVDISFGVAAGSSDKAEKGSVSGVGGLGGKVTPSAVLVIKDGTTKLVNIRNQDATTKILDMIPDLVDKFTRKKSDMPSDKDVRDVAFPEEEPQNQET
jgi:uncharacterized spore protein YtfJ